MKNTVKTNRWSKTVRFFTHKEHLVQITKQTHPTVGCAFQEDYIIYEKWQPENGDVAAVGVGSSEIHAKTTEQYCIDRIDNGFKKGAVVYLPEFKDNEIRANKLRGTFILNPKNRKNE